ncbi:hypothetical protein RhiirA1_479809, partial [Rhizophagus irregularis]
ILQEVFDQLNVLESIHIIYCDSLNPDFVQQIIKVIKPFKLRSLFMNEIILNEHIESLLLLLQKFSDCLENFGFGCGKMGETIYYEQKQQLFEFIIKYCKKIRYFYSGIPYYNNNNNSIYLLIEKNQHIINYIIIEGDFFENYSIYKDSSILLRNLGQKYIMKKERVKYLAIVESDSNASTAPVELFFLKDEVNEYKLHNIIVKKYDDLYIDTFSYINNHTQC